MYTLKIQRFFEAAHQLPDSPDLLTKQCAQLHGHSYFVKVSLRGDNKRGGMVIDFKAIKEIIDILDHKYINDVFVEQDFGVVNEKGFTAYPSTAENITRFLYGRIRQKCPDLDAICIDLCEGYKGEESSSWIQYAG